MDVLFVVMPFADVGRPAMGVSLLKPHVHRAGLSASIEYFNFSLAERIGLDLYRQIANGLPPDLLVGEWFFADDLFGDRIPHQDEYLQDVLGRMVGQTNPILTELCEARKARASFLEECVRTVVARSPRVVGFTTTFHQTCPSLALARRLKSLPNPPTILFGGANCEGEMGLQMIRSFPWIDCLCGGEADVSFPLLLEELVGRRPPTPIAGVLRQEAPNVLTRPEPIQDMNALPFPDFDEYFERVSRSSLGSDLEPDLSMETSRGCWWGAKHHCTFCGLNGDTMAFRSKTPERAFSEMAFLTSRYQIKRLSSVDNILDLRYVDTLFTKLATSGLDLSLFFEVKSNLRFDQLVTLRKGGMRHIQPGIESFSNQVLQLMDKGCTVSQNVQLLRWCQELDIEVFWNVLAGFPGESPSEYDRMAQLIPRLTHLPAPCSCAQIRLDRFGPLHSRPEAFGVHRLRPARAYYFVFPLGRRELSRLAYFFDFDYVDGRDVRSYLLPVERAIGVWWSYGKNENTPRPRLDAEFTHDGETLIVADSRSIASAARHELTGIPARVLAHCDVAKTADGLTRQPEFEGHQGEVRHALAALEAAALVAEWDGHFMALPVFRNRPASSSDDTTHAYAASAQAAPAQPLLRLVRSAG